LTLALALWLPRSADAAETPGAFDFSFVAIDGKPMPFAAYRGKVLLVVNTASFCGYTPQYEGLQKLYDSYKDRGLVVIGMPANDFGQQEPGSAKEIKEFCDATYNVQFPMTDKQVVAGPGANPFHKWAAAELGAKAVPKWNFHKVLIGRDGRAVDAFPSKVTPSDQALIAAVETSLKAPASP